MIAVTGGGTGGHLSIARALGAELRARGEETIFIGSTSGQDRAWFEGSGEFKFEYFLPSGGVVNKHGFAKLASLINIAKLSFRAREIFARHGVHTVISVGGYSSAPASFAALATGRRLFIHEQNAATGRLNALLKPFASGFFSSYQSPNWDYPVNEEFFAFARERNNLKTILFLGGSQGASFINDLALALAPSLAERGVSIIHQCGERDLERVKTAYSNLNIPARVFAFSKEIAKLMSEADLCVSRAGASTLWELCANRLPTVFIPYPFAAGNHQYFNAEFLMKKGLARIFAQSEINLNSNLNEIKSAIFDSNLNEISRELAAQVKRGGAAKIIDEIMKKPQK